MGSAPTDLTTIRRVCEVSGAERAQNMLACGWVLLSAQAQPEAQAAYVFGSVLDAD